jgi:hypothetical protein
MSFPLMPFVPPITGKPFSLEYRGSAGSTVTQTTYTFASRSLGAGDVNRKIIVAVFGSRSTSGDRSIVAVRVDGVTATIINAVGNSHKTNGLYIADVSGAATVGDIEVEYNGANGTCHILWFALYKGVIQAETFSFNASATSRSISLPVTAGGISLATAHKAGGEFPSGGSITLPGDIQWTVGATEVAERQNDGYAFDSFSTVAYTSNHQRLGAGVTQFEPSTLTKTITATSTNAGFFALRGVSFVPA